MLAASTPRTRKASYAENRDGLTVSPRVLEVICDA